MMPLSVGYLERFIWIMKLPCSFFLASTLIKRIVLKMHTEKLGCLKGHPVAHKHYITGYGNIACINYVIVIARS